MATSRHVMLLVVACTLAVLFIGAAEGAPEKYCKKYCKAYLPNTIGKCENYKCVYKCKDGYGDCDYKKYNGCETKLYNNDKHCGSCHNYCKVTWGPYAYAYCKGKDCYQQCKHGYKYDDYSKKCVKYYKCKHGYKYDEHSKKCVKYYECKHGYKYDEHSKKCVKEHH